jgi:hypothetical protein
MRTDWVNGEPWNAAAVNAFATEMNATAAQADSLDTRLTAVEAAPPGSGGTGGSRFVPFIIFTGESNSGGFALNDSGPTAHELAVRPAVQIYNPSTKVFADLDIGTNNMIGHSGLDGLPVHGWELGLANSVEAGEWWNDTVYMAKTGHGGSGIGQWDEDDSYYLQFEERTTGAIKILHNMGLVPVIYLWFSLGINDASTGSLTDNGPNEAAFMAKIKDLHARQREHLGYIPIIMTEFQTGIPAVGLNDSFQAYAAEDNMVFTVSAAGVTLRDPSHWDYEGMKLMSSRLISTSLWFGEHESYQMRQASALFGIHAVPPLNLLPSIVVAPTALTFTEGTPGTFTVALSAAPTGNVTITVAVTGGGASRSPATLTFTTTNWNTPQTVTITSANDGTAAGARFATVTLSSIDVISNKNVGVTINDAEAGATNLVKYDWKDFANTAQDGAKQLSITTTGGSAGTGAQTTAPVDATSPFAIVWDWLTAADAHAFAFNLTEAPLATYLWGSEYYVSCLYNYGGTAYSGPGGTAVNTGWGPGISGYPLKIKAAKSGNDLVYSSSPDGTTWTVRYTDIGVLTGKTVLYPRMTSAEPSIGQRVTMYYDQSLIVAAAPSNTSPPVISGSSGIGDTLTCSTGAWLKSPTSYAYQWKRDGTNISGATANTYVVVTGDGSHTLTCTVTATNATGSASATSAGVPVSPPLTAITWGSLTNCDSPSAGKIQCTTAAAGGGVGDSIDLTSAFELHVTLPAGGATSEGMLCFLDDDNSPTYNWDASNVFIIGVYQYGGVVFAPRDGNVQPNTGLTIPAYPITIKMVKSGDDLVYYAAVGAASFGSSFYTATGVLAGKTTGYVKSLMAVPSVGQNITVKRGP